MQRCLNPKRPHENKSQILSGDTTVALSGITGEQASVTADQQVACQYCKYLLEGALLGDCRVFKWVGSGAFGDVYEAEQLPPLSRRVAIKVMSLERVFDEQSAQLFEHEVRAIAALDHPNILPVLRVGTIEDGRSYLVMKFAAHGSLQQFSQMTPQALSVLQVSTPTQDQVSVEQREGAISDAEAPQLVSSEPTPDFGAQVPIDSARTVTLSESGQDAITGNETVVAFASKTPMGSILTPQQLLPYLESAAVALQYAHNHGILHLDVKPANLLLDSEDRLLLADFGVSALLDGYTHASLHGYVGTPLYTAPEQWLQQPRAASDQYALAITCYQLLTGYAPFMGNLYSIMHGHIKLPPPPLREFNPLIPSQVEAVILRGLAKEPTDRYPDMPAFYRAYRQALESAAGEQTDVHGQRADLEAGQARLGNNRAGPDLATPPERNGDIVALPTQKQLPLDAKSVPASTEPELRGNVGVPLADVSSLQTLSQASVARAPGETPLAPTPPRARKGRARIVGLVLLALLLVASSTLGILRIFDSCLLGICPAMNLNTTDVSFTNGGSQQVKISNTGSADLLWSVSLQGSASWLTLSPTRGTLSPGKATFFAINANSANLNSGDYHEVVLVTGQGVPTQDIGVSLSVQTGLAAIKLKDTGTNFSYIQGILQPSSQAITITNNSGQPLTWFTQYSENTWLVVVPNHGVLNDGQSVDLTVVANVQNLTPNGYFATLTLIGTLGTQVQQNVLGSYDFRLDVAQSIQTPTATSQKFHFPQFNAQAALSTNAPTALRSAHSMLWDAKDNLLLVFGGIDDKGNLLNDFWSYNPSSGNWTEINNVSQVGNCGSMPSPRMNAAMVWDSFNNQVLLYGGVGANNHYLGDLWSYSTSAGWALLQCSNNGPGARSANAVWDGQEMLLLGGMNRRGPLADFWSYTPGSINGWQRLPDSPMGARAYQTLVWDSDDSRLYVFGGLDASGVQQNDFWSYSKSSGWMTIQPATTDNPLGRQQGIGAWDSTKHVLYLMGGWQDGQPSPYFGFWVFDPKQNAWALLTPLDSKGVRIIPGRTAAAMVWDATDHRAYIYAGAGNDKTHSSLNDLWMIT